VILKRCTIPAMGRQRSRTVGDRDVGRVKPAPVRNASADIVPRYSPTAKVSICAAAMVHVAPSSANDADSIARAPTMKCESAGESFLSPKERETVGRGGAQEDGESSGSAAGSLRQSSPESTKTIGRALMTDVGDPSLFSLSAAAHVVFRFFVMQDG
jgi:hypothetical protein